MNLYIITYSLSGELSELRWLEFLKKIKAAGEWNHPLETVWFLKSDKSKDELLSELYTPGCFTGICIAKIESSGDVAGLMPAPLWKWLEVKD